MDTSDSVNQPSGLNKTPVETPPPVSSATAVPPPATPSLAAVRTEKPVEPPHPYRPFERKEDEAAIGNPEMIFALKISGQLGVFYNRRNTTRIPTLITLNVDNIRTSAFHVLRLVIEHQIKSLDQLDNLSLTQNVDDVARQLANGVSVMTYLKVRAVNYFDGRVSNLLRRKPKVPVPFEVPLPYALAISQLGQIKVSGLPKEVYLTPGPPADADLTFGCDPNIPWSPAAYSHAVEHAKKLGLRFTTVDLTVKMGSSWWLFRPVHDHDDFILALPYPEENFTENTAVLAMLFALNAQGGFHNPIIDLPILGDSTYGTMLRRPPLGMALNTYYAIVDAGGLDYKVVN